MLNFFSNPVLIPLLLIGIGIGLWWVLSLSSVSEKKTIVNVFVDNVFYFLLIAFVVNGLTHFPEIIDLPYRLLILSTEVVSLSFLLVLAYNIFRYLKLPELRDKALISMVQLISFIGVVNHIYYYILYKSPLLIGLILLFTGLLSYISIVPMKGNRWMYASLFMLVLHLVLTRNQAVLYFGFVVTPELVALTAIEWSVLLVASKRRQRQSERT